MRFLNFGIVFLFTNLLVFAQEASTDPKIQELERKEVVLNAYFYLHQLGEIRKIAFEDNATQTIEEIDKSIFGLVTGAMVYHPEFNHEMADHVLDFISDNDYYKFTWSSKSNTQLLHILESVKR